MNRSVGKISVGGKAVAGGRVVVIFIINLLYLLLKTVANCHDFLVCTIVLFKFGLEYTVAFLVNVLDPSGLAFVPLVLHFVRASFFLNVPHFCHLFHS